jgi:hypothetical protein
MLMTDLDKDYYIIDGQNTQLILKKKGKKSPPKLHPGDGFFGP